jgi:hypothetical protein
VPDTQATVKNIIFTVAQMQNIDPSLPLYILLEGTDHLEGLFGDCRTQDHARNFDLEQLSGKLGVATLINIGNPELDRGHRRLSLQDAMGIDHVNPRSWTGSVCVGDVDIKAEWTKGHTAAKSILHKYFGKDPVNFNQLFSKTDHDLLRPLGKYIGVKSIADDACSEDENSTKLIIRLERDSYSGGQAVHISEDSSSNINPGTNENEKDNSHDSLGMDIDDFLPDPAEEIDQNTEPEIFSKFLTVDGKEILKTSLVAGLSSNCSKKVTM